MFFVGGGVCFVLFLFYYCCWFASSQEHDVPRLCARLRV